MSFGFPAESSHEKGIRVFHDAGRVFGWGVEHTGRLVDSNGALRLSFLWFLGCEAIDMMMVVFLNLDS